MKRKQKAFFTKRELQAIFKAYREARTKAFAKALAQILGKPKK